MRFKSALEPELALVLIFRYPFCMELDRNTVIQLDERFLTMDKQKHREFRKIVDQILWDEWDPIGINDCIEARDEYSSYAGTICGKLWNGEGKKEILDYLYWAENENMGLSRTKKQVDEKNGPLTERIIALFSNYKT